jgi:hypothetical protein
MLNKNSLIFLNYKNFQNISRNMQKLNLLIQINLTNYKNYFSEL